MPPDRAWTRCLVLAPTDADASDAVAAVTSRDWHVHLVHDPHLAMADLCIRHRNQITRSAWGLPTHELAACVIVQPESWDAMDEFLAAVDKFLPQIQLFRFAAGTLSSLRPGRPEPRIDTSMAAKIFDRGSAFAEPTPEGEGERDPETRPATPKPLRIVHPDDSDMPGTEAEDRAHDAEPDDLVSPGITPEEIEMLLASKPDGEGDT